MTNVRNKLSKKGENYAITNISTEEKAKMAWMSEGGYNEIVMHKGG